MATLPSLGSDSFLIRGGDYLAAHPGFSLIGRKDEINAINDVLLRKSASNNLVLYGNNGVGISSLLLGIEAAKKAGTAPVDIAAKAFYYLDVDALFSSADPAEIAKNFETALSNLSQTQETVLVINDAKGFLDGLNNANAHNLVNILMHTLRTSPRFQIVFETTNETFSELTKAHTSIQRDFTFMEIKEPSKDDLRPIVESLAARIERTYGVSIGKEAITSVLELTEKFPGITLGLAQPRRAQAILESAMVTYLRTAQEKPAGQQELEATLAAIDSGNLPADLQDKSENELAALRIETENGIASLTSDWVERQKKLSRIAEELLATEKEIATLNAQIAVEKDKVEATKKAREAWTAADGNEEEQKKIKKEYYDRYQEVLAVGDLKEKKSTVNFNLFSALAGNAEVSDIEEKRKKQESLLVGIRARHEEITKSFKAGLSLTGEGVLTEFSRLSNVPASRLNEDEKAKVLRLAETIKKRVFGQDAAVDALADAILRSTAGLKAPKLPVGTFLFLGPSGVGKTELAKALAEALFGDEASLQTYNMSEYGAENAVNTMIGSPKGYVGYEEGGQLTNNMRANPYCVNLFDEAEKAHKDTFDIFLQIAAEGELNDRQGRKVSFSNAVNILTSNLGAEYFLSETLSYEEASQKAIRLIKGLDVETGEPLEQTSGGSGGKLKSFRPEFLNRLDGIFCFNRLGEPQILMIADKYFKKLNERGADKGLSIEISDKDKKEMCSFKTAGGQYDPTNGGRGIEKYIQNTITTAASRVIVAQADPAGTLQVKYDKNAPADQKVSMTFVPKNATPAKTAKPAKAAKPAPN